MDAIIKSESHDSLFDQIKQVDTDGQEYWLARELMPVLGYQQWRQFEDAVQRAIAACKNMGSESEQHFFPLTYCNGGRPGKNYKLTLYACHLILGNIDIRKKKNFNRLSEKFYSDRLQKKLGGTREVQTPAGFIDLLTDEQIIEVKKVNSWKAAVGQVEIYRDYYPFHEKRIHLFGKCHPEFLKIVIFHCTKRKIIVTWEA
ncbi:DNA-damage-inducible protein (plasmid) [Calothrix brevissima NIES-22]|nr:DNA-damage-inducible protein [Calothrix brevissima NIES-22]